MPKRKPLSKKLRFDVFKRDGFECGYCGATPPSVVLEVDHIEPVSKGGNNDIDNLITSCFDCNRGKSANSLTAVPQSINEKTELIKEKNMQVKEFRKAIKEKRARMTRDVNKIANLFSEYFDDRCLTIRSKQSVKNFLEKLPLHEVEDAMNIAAARIDNDSAAYKYFCGICWNKIRDDSE